MKNEQRSFRVRVNAVARLLAKLPTRASSLTPVERAQLRDCEREGIIAYNSENGCWFRVSEPEDGLYRGPGRNCSCCNPAR